jgi:signal transduction histidine kinase
MTWEMTPQAWLQASVFGVDVVLALLLWRRRSVPGGRMMFAALLAFAWWSACGALEWSIDDGPSKIVLRNLAYAAITVVPALLLVFGLEYTGRAARYRHLYGWLAVEPVVVQGLIWTNPLHGLHYASSEVVREAGLLVIQATYGPAFWAHALYSYLLMIGGVALIAAELLRATRLYRWQVGLILTGMLIPWVSNALYLGGAFDLGGADPAPAASTLMAIVVTWALLRYRFMDVLPVAQERIVAGMSDGVVIVDGDRAVLVNPSAARILGLPESWDDGASSVEEMPEAVATTVRAWDGEERAEAEIELPVGDGRRSYLLRQVPVARGDRRRLLTLIDNDERKETERVLQKRRTEAESASRAKSDFVANMSHELRTPLNAILGYTRLVSEDEGLSPEHRHAIATIESSGEHLLTLINEVLDLSKVEAGAEQVLTEPFDLSELIGGLAGMFELSCARKGLIWRLEKEIPQGHVRGDHGKLRQVLINLLGNAVKFTDEGQVVLSVLRDGEVYRFTVTDTGPGIPADRQEAVFEPFQQEEAGRRQGGTGLGLAIARRHVELMGGRLRLESAPGQGTRISFDVHLPSGTRAGAATEAAADVADVEAELPERIDLPVELGRALNEAVRTHDLTALRRHLTQLSRHGASARQLQARLQVPAGRYDMAGVRQVLQEAGLLDD